MLLPFLEEQSGIFSVSELNAGIRSLLEATYPFVWVRGEISNFRIPASGHCYFTLKDEQSQIRAVLFRAQHRLLRFVPESGMQVLCRCRLSVYEPRGEYQLIVETMEPHGLGALQLAFEQLKGKLQAEGLFDTDRKKPLPVCPRKIAIVTSSTGAAIRDILKVFQRSPYPLTVTVFPVRVQGAEASAEIATAINTLNIIADKFEFDVAVVGRGGGSLEDLWPFNEEVVARALALCRIPTISAVGHEIDFTISDMVADFRAPTPTAAAEWVVAKMESFDRGLSQCRDALLHALSQTIADVRHHLRLLEKGLVDPKRRLTDLRLLLDDRLDRLQLSMDRHLEKLRLLHTHLKQKLDSAQPMKNILQHKTLLDQQTKDIAIHYEKILDTLRLELQKCAFKLDGLNPLAVLARGYSITYRISDSKVIRNSNQVRPGQGVRVRLAEGFLECLVEKTE